MRKLVFTLMAALLPSIAFAWGQKGHDIVAYIAECNLTPKAYRKVVGVLDGHSPVYYANWLDGASHTPEYAYTKTWHYKNIDEGETFENALLEPKGDIVGAIKMQIETLSDKSISKEQRATALKMLVHLMGDLHQPMHMGRRSDRGGNQFAVTYFNRKANLHGIWDSAILEDGHKWSNTEWADEIDLAVIPGVAFDRHGVRLGRGKGYYDRLLPLMLNAYRIGICFPFQLLEQLPSEPHDVLMNEVVDDGTQI